MTIVQSPQSIGRPQLASEQPLLQSELIFLLYQHSSKIRSANFIAVAIAVAVLWSRVPTTALVIWALLSSLQTVLHMALDKYYLAHRPQVRDELRWGWIFTTFSALASLLWGALGVMFYTPDDFFVTGFIIIILAGISTGSVAPQASFLPTFYATALCMLLPFAIRCLAYGGQVSVSLGILILLLLYANMSNAKVAHKSLRETIMLRFENLDLVQQLMREKTRAEEANRDKTRFLAAASHDLRQPTHALGLFVATLAALAKKPEIRPAEIAGVTAHLQTTLKSMGQLLNVLLDVSRLEAGVVEAVRQPVDLQELFAALRCGFAGPASAKGLMLDIPPTDLWAETDPVILHTVLSNLLSNALRYTDKGRVWLEYQRLGDQVRIAVCDTGIGIADDQQEKIFQEFYQVGNVARLHEQGLGLGLAIVRRLVALLAVQLTLDSTQGRGSVFALVLPMAERAAIPAPVPAPVAGSAPQRGLAVLVIDDDQGVRSALTQLLGAWGHTVLAASGLEEAVALARQAQHVDLILADYRLEGTSTGVDAIHAVRAALGSEPEAVIITGDTSPERIREASVSGFALLHKPLDPPTLQALLTARATA